MNSQTREERASAVLGILKQIEDEGIFVSEETRQDAHQYVEGIINTHELMQRIRKRSKIRKR